MWARVMIKVSIVEDDALYTELIVWALSKHKDIRVAGKFGSADEALLDIPRQCPDVILMDLGLPGMSGIECIRQLRKLNPPVAARVLVLTGHEQEALMFDAMRTGVDGYLLKHRFPLEGLAASIREVHNGGAAVTSKISHILLASFQQAADAKAPARHPPKGSVLSGREEEVLVQLSKGLMYKEIAVTLKISIDTVRKHTGAIYRKLHVPSRTLATR